MIHSMMISMMSVRMSDEVVGLRHPWEAYGNLKTSPPTPSEPRPPHSGSIDDDLKFFEKGG